LRKKILREESSEPDVSERIEETIELARELGGREQWTAACEVLRPLAQAALGASELWLQIAQWEKLDGRLSDAQATLRHALQLNAGRDEVCVTLWQGLVEATAEASEWSGCIEACGEALKVSRRLRAASRQREAYDGRDHRILEIMATACAHEGRYDEAVAVVRELLKASPRDPLHRMRLGSLLQASGRIGDASREFELVTHLAPGTAFGNDAETALDLLEKSQIQQILMRAGEERAFGWHLERDLEGALADHAFYLSDSGMETLRQMIEDGRPSLSTAPRVH
jgi:tetratricopeptide (TPR) repeat protein